MTVIPVINCKNYSCVQDRIDVLKTLNSEWVKFDISDGKFNEVLSWNDPEELKEDIQTFFEDYKVEVHLMVDNTYNDVERWLSAGAKRIIIHVESNFDIENILNICQEHNGELMIAKNPTTPISSFKSYLDHTSYFQLLAVDPGPSGQEFKESVLEEIKSLRELKPDVKIEIDGGINEAITKKVKEAGADIIVSSSYIFKSSNPKKSFDKLKLI